METSATDIDRFLEDASGYRGNADRAFAPADAEELRGIVRTAAINHIPVTVAGAGTGLTGACVPRGGWVVSLDRFRKIEVETDKARCGAGVILSQLQQAAAWTKQFFGPNPTESSACIGGIISTNAGGARSFRYGSVRGHVLALEVTLMDARTLTVRRGERVDFPVRSIHAPATTKNSAGYYLRPDLEWIDLFSGSEGTLGIVTEAELRLFPDPAAILSGVVFFPSEDLAFDALEDWRAVPELRLLEFMDEHALRLLRSQYSEIPLAARAALLVEQNLDSEEGGEIEEWAQRLCDRGAFEEQSWFGFGSADRDRFREFRHALPAMVVDIARRNGFPKFGTDFAVPVNRGRDLHAYYKQRCEEVLPGQYTIFGHAGDANNHVNLFPGTFGDARKVEELMYELARYVVSLDGTVAAEHGIGKNKTDLLKLMYSPEEIEAMVEVKRRLDPQWLLGQGTIFGSGRSQ